jgi:diguanylate cyclase (GGDEF)-like protein
MNGPLGRLDLEGRGAAEQPSHGTLHDSVAADIPVLQSLLRISQAVLGANYFDEALEVIAEQALTALKAASLSISRWDRHDNVLRTLINVGELGPGEQRWPEGERYEITENTLQLLEHGRPYLNSIDDEDADPTGLALLRQLDKESELAVAVMHQDEIWGELWVAGVDGRRFGPDDVQLLQAIAAHIAVAIGRSELFSTVWSYAFEDPLTGLANRRKLDEFLEQLDCDAVHPAVLVCDLDEFKVVNDRDGHPAGDALLRAVADVLAETASTRPGSLVARLGGDEFCVILLHSTLAGAERFAHDAGRGLASALGTKVTLSWGAAAFTSQARSPHVLVAAADAALLEAKRHGPGRFSVGVAGDADLPASDRRRLRGSGRRAFDDLVPWVVRLIDHHRPQTTAAALEILGVAVSNELNAAGWSVSIATDDGLAVRSLSGIDSLHHGGSGLRVLDAAEDTAYWLADFPATARAIAYGEVFVAALDLEGSDPAEIALLLEYEYYGVLGVGIADAQRRYLLEIYSDSEDVDLTGVAPYVRVLAHYCAAMTSGQRPHHW